ncbi:MAG TPA: hypothetical protein VLV78_07455 [Thermoanaerobaculia bacterium]|nr:hypothetical protein [Thermoanaerobaculia bacterium]
MQAYGTDRLRPGKGDQFVLFCRRSKGWQARIPKTHTTAVHPGTAIAWDDRIFEVVVAEAGPQGSVRYVLEPWRAEHIIRVSESYDAASEVQRETEYHAAVTREKGRQFANLTGVFTGLLPAAVQEHLGSELGLLPEKMTSLSLILPLIYIVWVAMDVSNGIIHRDAKTLPPAFALLAAYLFVESAVRLQFVWFQRRPIASAVGFFGYLLYWLVIGRSTGAISPFTVPKGEKLFITTPTEDVALHDAYSMREPLLTLLSPEEQKALAERFGYNYRTYASTVAWVLLAFSAAGAVTSLVSLQYGPRFGSVTSLLVAILVGGEQATRLNSLRKGPVGSFLAVLVRPLTRKLLK